MTKRQGAATFHGTPLTLVGDEVKVGDKAPDFTVLDNDLNQVGLADFAGKILIITSVPSLDTPVCDMETRRFNTEAGNLSEHIRILTISMDLPFAQKRWCGAAGVNAVSTYSDHRLASFGENWGVLIEELRLLARAVFVVDATGVVRYVELVREMTAEPYYEGALNAAKKLV